MKCLNFFNQIAIIFMASSVLLVSCSSTTLIQTEPTNAKVYIDDEFAGNSPYSHSDQKIVGSVTRVKIEKEGYDKLDTSFQRNEEVDVGAIIGGLFFLFPFLWTMKYKAKRTYELEKSGAHNNKYDHLEDAAYSEDELENDNIELELNYGF